MEVEGKYLYCIIGTNEGRNFGPIGIGGRGDVVSTIGYQDLSGVISNSPLTKYVISRENLSTHEWVIEKVMEDYTVLPVRFCTIAASADEIRSLLRKRYREFKDLLCAMDHKIELGLKAFWKSEENIFQEIVGENERIRRLRGKLAKNSSHQAYKEKIALGEMVQSALLTKKEAEAQEILGLLKSVAVEFRLNESQGDRMLLNAAFLIDRGREKEFDSRIDDLERTWGDRIQFKYVGPAPPFNFVNLVVKF